MKKLFLFLFFTLFSLQAFSQVNIETVRNKVTQSGFWGEIKSGLELQRGNVEITSFDIENINHYQLNSHHAFIKLNTSKGTQNKENFKNNSFAHLRWTWMTWKKLGFEVFTQVQHDEFKKLNIRQLNGVGLRSEIYKLKDYSLSIGTGIMSDYEKIEDNTSTIDPRSTSYISLIRKFNKKNEILSTIYYQPLINNINDYRINLECLIKTNLITKLNLKIENSITFLYDTKPPEDVLTNDFIIKTSLIYNW